METVAAHDVKMSYKSNRLDLLAGFLILDTGILGSHSKRPTRQATTSQQKQQDIDLCSLSYRHPGKS